MIAKASGATYDALLIVSFGGPRGPQDILPFLERVLKGRRVPPERIREVAHHYEQIGGVSPINEQNERLVASVRELLETEGPNLPVYLGNRNWHPLLEDTLQQMAAEGVDRALAFFTSPYSSYSSCRQYRENIREAQDRLQQAPQVDKIRAYFNHPGFIEPNIDHVRSAFAELPQKERSRAQLVFTAHSIPVEMARASRYEEQLLEACRLVAERVGANTWDLAYQSRSGLPHQAWLEPDICDRLEEVQQAGTPAAVISPIGFISDHMEVVYDLDVEAAERSRQIGLRMVRAATVGVHPEFIRMIRLLILERTAGHRRQAEGRLGPSHDVCPPGCCRPSG